MAPLALALLLAGCSVTYVQPRTAPALTEPTAPPTFATTSGEAAGNVGCPATVGTGSSYGLFGAAAADFNAAHQGASPLIRCSTDLKVVIMQLDLAPGSADGALAAARAQLPSDLKPVYDRSETTCRQLQFESSSLATLLGKDDPQGVVNVELESALVPDFKYDATRVDTVVIHQQYDLNQVRPCLRG